MPFNISSFLLLFSPVLWYLFWNGGIWTANNRQVSANKWFMHHLFFSHHFPITSWQLNYFLKLLSNEMMFCCNCLSQAKDLIPGKDLVAMSGPESTISYMQIFLACACSVSFSSLFQGWQSSGHLQTITVYTDSLTGDFKEKRQTRGLHHLCVRNVESRTQTILPWCSFVGFFKFIISQRTLSLEFSTATELKTLRSKSHTW